MSSAHRRVSRPYPAVIPVALLLAVSLPVGAVVLFNLYWVPLAMFLMASLPFGVALYLHGFLPVPRSAILIGAVGYVVGGLLSTLVAGGDPTFRELGGVFVSSVLILYFLFLLSLVPLLTRGESSVILLTMVLACGVSAGLNAALFFSGDPRTALPGSFRFVAAIGVPSARWPTAVSATYAVFLSAAFALLALPDRSRWVRILATAAAVAIGTGLMLTLSRGGYIAALAGIVSVLPFATRRVRLLAAGGIGAVLLFSFYSPIAGALLDRGMSYRTDIWWDYLRWGWENPLIGQGMLANVHRVIAGFEIHHAHNLLISGQVRGGLLGLAGMAVMLGGGLYWTWAYARRFGDPVFLAMIVALCVAGMFDYELLLLPTDWTWATFWLPIGLAAGAELAVRRDHRTS